MTPFEQMTRDSDQILSALKARFPGAEVTNNSREGYLMFEVYFESCGDAVTAMCDDNHPVWVGVLKHIRNEDFKPDSYDVSSTPYSDVAALVAQMVKGAEEMLRRWREFEAEEDAILADAGMKRFESIEPACVPGIEAVLKAGENAIIPQYEREH